MSQPYDLRTAFTFLNELKRNNSKPWFDAHRHDYEESRRNVEAFVSSFIEALRPIDDVGPLSAREVLMRINRDVRFSRDKSPYRTNVGAEIAPGGRRGGRFGYFIHLEPGGGSLLGGGMYMPLPEQLAKFRQAIAEDAEPFKRIVQRRGFVKQFGAIEGERLATAPQGYQRTHPEIDLLRLRQVLAARHFPDAEVLAPDFLQRTVEAAKELKPFNDWLNSHLL